MEYNLKVKYSAEYLRGLSYEDLSGLMLSAAKKRYELRMQEEEIKPHFWKRIRKDIAKIKTIFKERHYAM